MTYELRITIFVIVSILAISFLLFWFLYSPIKSLLWKLNPGKMFYRGVYKVVRNYDFYLVNNLELKIGGDSLGKINHLIGGDKFLYLVTEVYYDGVVEVRSSDRFWVKYLQDGTKTNVPNPIIENQKILDSFALVTGFSQNFLIGIVLINDDCFISRYDNNTDETILVPISKLENVIGNYEKRDVKPFNKEVLSQVIRDLHDSNVLREGKE